MELWLKHGDKNSKLFYLSTIIQRRWNNLDSIKAEKWFLDLRVQPNLKSFPKWLQESFHN